MNILKKWWQLISYIGVKPEYDIVKRSKVILTNQFAIITLTFPVYFSYIFYTNMPNNSAWLYQLLYLSFPLVFWFNHKGYHKTASFFMIMVSVTIEFLLCSTFGYDSGEHVNLLTPFFAFFVIYNWENMFDLLVILVPTLASIVVLFATDFSLLLDTTISKEFLKENYISSYINNVILMPIFGIINYRIIRKQANALVAVQKELAESIAQREKENNKLIIDHALDAVLSIDVESTIQAWNKQAEVVFGYRADEVIGQNMVDIVIPPQHRESHSLGMQRFMATGQSKVLNRRIEITGINKAGEEFPIELSIVKILQDNKVTFSAFIRDLRERYQAEKEIKEREAMIAKTNRMLAELRLNALKSQINPHFYFNTLNNLYGLALINSDRTPQAILMLSGIMEYIIYDCNSDKVLLSKELDFIKNYIEIEKLRYFDNADIQLHIEGEAHDLTIVPMILVQFIENAFKHGLQKMQEGGFLHININIVGREFNFSIKNAKPIFQHSDSISKEKAAGGIGLQNAQNRLYLLYFKRHELEIIEHQQSFEVILKMTLDNKFE